MHSWFDILQAKGLNIEFTSREKDHILNRAQIKFVNEVLQNKYLPSLRESERAELVYSVTDSVISGHDYIHPVLGRTSNIAAGTGGKIYFDDINTAIDTRLDSLDIKPSGYSGSKFMMILSVIDSDSYLPIRYLNTSDYHRHVTNVFRAPKEYDPTYTIAENYIVINPKSLSNAGGKEFVIYYIREPEPVHMANDGDDRIDCELPEHTHDEIMAIALDDAGVATRDQTLIQLNQANKSNLTESV